VQVHSRSYNAVHAYDALMDTDSPISRANDPGTRCQRTSKDAPTTSNLLLSERSTQAHACCCPNVVHRHTLQALAHAQEGTLTATHLSAVPTTQAHADVPLAPVGEVISALA
jgi:hypothetical protein